MKEDNTQYFCDEWNKENILIIDLNTNKEYNIKDVKLYFEESFRDNLIFGTNRAEYHR
jgi:hypothetical protein